MISATSAEATIRLQGWRKPADCDPVLPDCTLIVPTRRRPREMVRLLEHLETLSDPPGQVLVVDGSVEQSVDLALRRWSQERELRFELLYISSPPGLTRQRNVGIDACDNAFVFFLDDDCLPESGYFRNLRAAFERDTEGRVGGVRGFLTNGLARKPSILWHIRRALRIAPRGYPGQYHHCCTSGTWDGVAAFSGTRPVQVLAGGASAFRREVFDEFRFSEFFYGYAQGEDLEMSLRIASKWKLMVCGDARVDHRHAESGRPSGLARGRMAFRNRYFIWKRHSPRANAVDRLRFWADHWLVIACYSACFLLRPWRPYHLGYAVGTLSGIAECLIHPPRHQEPPARKRYDVVFAPLRSIAIQDT